MSSKDAILQNWSAQLKGMDSADTDLLASCFTPDAVLVHMTGYRQPLDEWMRGIEAGQFVYHRVEEHWVKVTELSASSAHVSASITTGITDDGSGQAWPLRCEQDFVLTDAGLWLCWQARVTLG